MHSSVKLNFPCEMVEIVPYNPLISKCQIKVCYVSDEPNRNKSIITKEVAKEIANSLPGNPIVGYYNEAEGDFEEHNRVIKISNGELKILDTTKPYGFVDLNAKVWFQKFLDDDSVEREYLMTEGWLWTGQYPEAQRIIEQGNNQSMELDENFLDGTWTKDKNGKAEFFIINEAIISKLCILGENMEPCFEGAQITKVQFSLDVDFKEQVYSMINEIKNMLKEGGTPMFTQYAVEIGDALWNSLWEYLSEHYPEEEGYCSIYSIEGIYEEDGQKFAVLRSKDDAKFYRLNFDLTEKEGFVVTSSLEEVTKTFIPSETPQFSLEAVAEYAASLKEEKEDEKEEEETEEEEVCPECGKPLEDCECEEDKKDKYNLDEIQEYIELRDKFSQLEQDYNALNETYNSLKAENEALVTFKKSIEKKEKEAMIDSFYMLSTEDKREVLENIDVYSLDEIEAKLSIICVRNKVSFSLEEDKKATLDVTTYNLKSTEVVEESAPAWLKTLRNVAKEMK